jgi:hypothetical protein
MNDNTIKKISESMRGKFLDITDYKFESDHNDNLKLTSNVVIYNTGDIWKVIPFNVCLSYPIIYDKYSSTEETFDITFIICPVTLRSIYLKGKFEFLTYDESCRMILREVENKDTLIYIDIGTKIDKKYIMHTNKRSEVKITTLRNALTFLPDAHFLNLNESKKIKYIIENSYYENKLDINGDMIESGIIHPKTLVYLIQFKGVNGVDKATIILGKDISSEKVTGYDAKQSHIFEYLDDHKKGIINKEGFIMPMLWYTTKIAYPSADCVYINK